MPQLFLTLLIINLFCLINSTAFAADDKTICNADSRFENRRLATNQVDNLCQTYQDKVILVVNTASRCAYTDQYDGLENLYGQYREQGLVVIGFPSNDFGGQEPGSEKNIQNFCRLTYGVKFPMYAKTKVIGIQADPFYQRLSKVSGQSPRWNFHKYLIDRHGKLIDSYPSSVEPQHHKLLSAIRQALSQNK